MVISRDKYNELTQRIEYLKEELESERTNNKRLKYLYEQLSNANLNKALKEFKYAILVDENYKVLLYNEGRFEPGVRTIEFESSPGYVPSIKFEK